VVAGVIGVYREIKSIIAEADALAQARAAEALR
jgi:hypothetical protein